MPRERIIPIVLETPPETPVVPVTNNIISKPDNPAILVPDANPPPPFIIPPIKINDFFQAEGRLFRRIFLQMHNFLPREHFCTISHH